MTDEEAIEWARAEADRLFKLVKKTPEYGTVPAGLLSPAIEFLRLQAPRSAFYTVSRDAVKGVTRPGDIATVSANLTGWVKFAESGMVEPVGFEVRARRAAANDLMEQVEVLLSMKGMFPAAAVMLAGAALEEALRGMFEAADGLKLPGRARPSIDSYATALRSADLITKTQKKDIDSCAGLRNAAAHGEFERIELPNAQLMAQQVNLLLSQFLD